MINYVCVLENENCKNIKKIFGIEKYVLAVAKVTFPPANK
jgi:hypothetical protein